MQHVTVRLHVLILIAWLRDTTCLLGFGKWVVLLVAWLRDTACLLGFGKWVVLFFLSFFFIHLISFYLRVDWLAKQFVSLCSRLKVFRRQKKLWSQA